ncbi:MAG: S1 RNA-binding domain-containing protein, partial [Paraperlucidibaca sp.]
LLTHRAIKAILHNTTYDPKVPWDQLGMQCSATERRADEATRDVMAWLKCEYMQDRVGEDFDGVIAAVTAFGFFVELKEVFVEGLVHISQLRDDYYQFDSTFHRLVGERTGKRFAIGESVRIKVASVNLDERKMDFELLTGGVTGKRSLRDRLREGDLPDSGKAAPKQSSGAKAGGKPSAKSDGQPDAGGEKPAKRTGARSGSSKPRTRKR